MRRRRRRPRIYELAPAARPPRREGNFAEGLSTLLPRSLVWGRDYEMKTLVHAVKSTKSTKEEERATNGVSSKAFLMVSVVTSSFSASCKRYKTVRGSLSGRFQPKRPRSGETPDKKWRREGPTDALIECLKTRHGDDKNADRNVV